MKVLLSWLQEFAPFEGDPVVLGEQMSDLGMAVESIDHLGGNLDGIVVARVLDLRPHPDADRIQLVDVDRGDGEALQVCCGAFNMAVGDLVPLATLSTVMPGGMRIERRKLRGQWSNGMLCSGAELELGVDHAGILVLAPDLVVGTPLEEALGLAGDVLYDLEINPNRPDAMSVAGVARDLAARLGLAFAIPEPGPVEVTGENAEGLVSVEIIDAELCGRFHARVLRGIDVGPSPRWIANRLTALGMRPINRVVDASNYVMLELGQPNHTYDLDKLAIGPDGCRGLRVRWARDGESIVTLDGVERTLSSGDGVIADAHADDAAVGIAGVMGGASTEIDGTTSAVLVEMAWWQPMVIARSSQRLGLRSEASMRFERGTDPDLVELASRRFAELLEGAELVGGEIDERGDLPERPSIRVRTTRVNGLLGTDLEADKIGGLLEPIGFEVETGEDAGELNVRVPSFRPDTTMETDVIEEVARHHGYANIARTVPPAVHIGGLTQRQTERRSLRQALVGLGFDEAMPLPFLAPGGLESAGLAPAAVTVTNPLVAEESILRTSLRPGLLQAIAYNESHRNLEVGLFEIGAVFGVPGRDHTLPDEREHLALIRAGIDANAAVEAWSILAGVLALDDWRLEQGVLDGLHPGRGAEVLASGPTGDEAVVGVLGEIDPRVLDRFDIRERVAWLELDLDTLLATPHGERRYHPISRYPSSDIDLAFEVQESTSAALVADTLRSAAGPLLVGLRLFDVFRGPPVPEGARSLAFALRLQADDRTLTDEEVGEVRTRAIAAVESTHPATLRA